MKIIRILALCLAVILGYNTVSAVETELLKVVDLQEFTYQSTQIDLYLVEEWDNGILEDTILINYSGDFLAYYGFIEDGVTNFESSPVWLTKVANISMGDSWDGVVEDGPVHMVYSGEVPISMPAGDFTAVEADMYDYYNNSIYLGKIWLSDGVGWLGFDANVFGVQYNKSLISYTIAGGEGNWPLAVGNQWYYELEETFPVYNAPFATISIDGDPSDWSSFDPAVEDPEGDDPSVYDGVDIKELYIAHDDDYLYMMISFWDGGPTIEWGASRTDAYHLYVMTNDDESEEIAYIYYDDNSGYWTLYAYNFIHDYSNIVCGDVLECSILLNNLGNPSSLYRYSLSVADMDENYDKSNFTSVNLAQTDIVRDETAGLPEDYLLRQNHPNPFNPFTTIEYSIPTAGNVDLMIYNILGKEVKHLVNEHHSAGVYSVQWDGTDNNSTPVASGIYFYRLKTDNFTECKRMVLLK